MKIEISKSRKKRFLFGELSVKLDDEDINMCDNMTKCQSNLTHSCFMNSNINTSYATCNLSYFPKNSNSKKPIK